MKLCCRTCRNIAEQNMQHEVMGALAGATMSLGKTCRIMYSLAAGLHSLHVAGIHHWDIKPANILIDMHGDAVLADVGISRIVQLLQAASRKTSLLPSGREGQLCGDANYMCALVVPVPQMRICLH